MLENIQGSRGQSIQNQGYSSGEISEPRSDREEPVSQAQSDEQVEPEILNSSDDEKKE